MSMEADHGPDQEPEKYSFLQENIKDEKMTTKKMIYKISWLVGRGILFGIAASIGFFALKPWAESTFQKNPDKIEIPKDEDVEEEIPDEDTEESVQQALTIENYRELNTVLVQTAQEAKKSVVEVSGIHGNGSVLDSDDSWSKKAAGVIVADNGQELLILTNTEVLEGTETLQVKFADNSEYNASLKKKASNIGLAVIGVDRLSVKDATWSRITVAELGNSNALSQGDTAIALGNPFGYSNGMGFGVISSIQEDIILADGEYRMLTTDMPGTGQGSGALFNIDGKVVGIIAPNPVKDGETDVITAYGISAIKREIELMLNAKDVPYIGIVGVQVTDEIAESQGIPKGVCVTEVKAGSPAMKAGIQNGDIITAIGKVKIESVVGYHREILTKSVGDEIVLNGQRRGAEGYVEIAFNVTVGIKE